MKKKGPNDFMVMFSYTIVIVGLLFAGLGITAMGFYLKTGVEQVCWDGMQAWLRAAFRKALPTCTIADSRPT